MDAPSEHQHNLDLLLIDLDYFPGPGGGVGGGVNPGTPGGPLPDIMAGSDAQKSSNKPISEYFPKRAPSSPVRGGTKSPLSFGSMYPQSPKTSYVASSPSGNASNGPMSYNQGDYYQQHPQQPGDYLLKSLQVILFDHSLVEAVQGIALSGDFRLPFA